MNLHSRVVGPAAAVCAVLALTSCSSGRSVYVGAPTFVPTPSGSGTPTGADATAASQPPAVPGKPGVGRFITVRSGGLERRYRLHLPLTGPTGRRPLVIAFHDGGSSALELARDSGLDGSADRNGVIVVYPEGIGGHWTTGLPADRYKTGGVDDVAFTKDVLLAVTKEARVDLARVAVTGIGDGALMALRYATLHPSDVLGVVAISGGLVAGSTPTIPRAPMSVTFVRGTVDPSLPWAGVGIASKIGPQLGVEQSIVAFLKVNGLAGKAPTVKEQLSDRDPGDRTRVTRTVWGPGLKGTTVTLFTVVNGGGPWPGGLGNTRAFARIGRVTRDLSGASVVIRFALETRRTP